MIAGPLEPVRARESERVAAVFAHAVAHAFEAVRANLVAEPWQDHPLREKQCAFNYPERFVRSKCLVAALVGGLRTLLTGCAQGFKWGRSDPNDVAGAKRGPCKRGCQSREPKQTLSRHEHRSDSLSAAFRNLDREARDDLTHRYDALCTHYRMEPTRNNRGVAHENGAIESPHGRLKHSIRDALLVGGTMDFEDLLAYRSFLDEIIGRKNARNSKRIERHLAEAKLLPEKTLDNFDLAAVPMISKAQVSALCTGDG